MWSSSQVLGAMCVLKFQILSNILFICRYLPNQIPVSIKTAPKPSYLSRGWWLCFKANSMQQFILKIIFGIPMMCEDLIKSGSCFRFGDTHKPLPPVPQQKVMMLERTENMHYGNTGGKKYLFHLEKR